MRQGAAFFLCVSICTFVLVKQVNRVRALQWRSRALCVSICTFVLAKQVKWGMRTRLARYLSLDLALSLKRSGSVYLLYLYKCANTDAKKKCGHASRDIYLSLSLSLSSALTRFTCSTSTNVQILTRLARYLSLDRLRHG